MSYLNGSNLVGDATISGLDYLETGSINATDITTTNLNATNVISTNNTSSTMKIQPSGSNATLPLYTIPNQYLMLYDNAILLRSDYWHYIKYVLSNTNAISGNVDGPWIQGYNGGVLASGQNSYNKQVHFQWRSGRNYSLVPFDCNDVLTTKLGIIASDTQSINFGSNAPTMSGANIGLHTIPDTALSTNVPLLSSTQIFTGDNTFSGDVNFNQGILNCGIDSKSINIGVNALNAMNYTGKNNVGIGYNSLKNLSLSTSTSNVAVGHYSGENANNSTVNTFIGTRSGQNFLTGSNNVFLGADSGSSITSGGDNLVVGTAMVVPGSGGAGYNANNIAIGSNAFSYVGTNATANVALGAYSLYCDNAAGFRGPYTVGIGAGAGLRIGTNCSNSTFIGANSGYSSVSPAYSDYTYVTCIGCDAQAEKSHSIVLGTNNEITYAKGGLIVYCTADPTNYPGWCWKIDLNGDLLFYDGIDENNYTIRLSGIGQSGGTPGNIRCNDIYTENLVVNTSLDLPNGSLNNLMCDGTIHVNYFDSPIFTTMIKLQNTNNNTLISNTLTTSFTGTNCIIMGNGAANNLGSNDSIIAIGTNALYSLPDLNGFQNLAIGNGALYYLSKGNYNLAVGNIGQALSYDCYENIMVGRNVMNQQFTKPITYILYSGSTLTSISTITMTAIPSGLYAGCRLLCYYSGNTHTAEVISYNPSTFVITLGNTVSITTGTYLYFFEKELMTASYLNPTLRTSVLSFTIGTGLNIYANEKMSYQTSATLVQTVGVVSYNSGSGLLTVSSNITVLASTTLYFMDTTFSWGSYSNNNTVLGSQSLSRICTGASGNVCIGQNVMSANDATTSKNYVGGSNNTSVGINSGSLCYFKSNNCTFIGANADILSSSDNNNITHATALGADSKCWGSNQIMLGSSSDTVHIPNQINIRTQFLPYAVSTITGTVNLTAPFYGTYIVNTTTTPITVSLPASISGNMVGMHIWFKRINNANVVNVNYVSGTNIIYIRNSSGFTTGNVTNTLLSSTQYAANMICLSTTSWAIIV